MTDRELCWYCCRSFPEEDGDPVAHVRKRHPQLSFECRICPSRWSEGGPAVFPDPTTLRDHVDKAHADDQQARSEADFTRPPVDLRSVRCQLCNLSFHAVGLDEMRKHFEDRHESEEFHGGFLDWHCRLCPAKEFDEEDELASHIAEVHSMSKGG